VPTGRGRETGFSEAETHLNTKAVQEDASSDGTSGAFSPPRVAPGRGPDGEEMANRREENTILYVDDESANLQLFRSAFSEQYVVLTASSGPEALRLLQENPVRVVFVDQRMPGMSGIQLLEAVAQSHPDTIRVLVTGYSDIDVVIEAINRGAVYRYISKPWDVDEVAATIRDALEIHTLKSSNQALVASLDAQNRLLKRKVEELRFLNELDLRLKELRDQDSVLRECLETLGMELQALEGWHVEASAESPRLRWRPAQGPWADEAERLDLSRLRCETLQAPYIEALSSQRSVCILPLSFQGLHFGYLVFCFPGSTPFEPEELLFTQAASHVVSSILYGLHAHDEELHRERFILLGQMASMVAHDLKGPLATILGFVTLLQADLGSEQRSEFAGIINQEVRRLIEMVEELLSFSKGEAHLNRQRVDLPALLREVLDLFEIGFRRENIRTELHQEGSPFLQGDPRKLQKVFINLLQNAREHLLGTEGDRVIRIDASGCDGETVIAFTNNGPPIPQELLPRIFDPFVSYRKEQGTGLGLTICRKIVEEHGGRIEVGSVAEGTSFRIVLPAALPPGPGS
jgi:CheY-like chemotaxis protein